MHRRPWLSKTGGDRDSSHPELELQQRRGHNAKAHQDHQVKDTVHPISKGACKGDVFCGDSITFSSPDCSTDLLL